MQVPWVDLLPQGKPARKSISLERKQYQLPAKERFVCNLLLHGQLIIMQFSCNTGAKMSSSYGKGI